MACTNRDLATPPTRPLSLSAFGFEGAVDEFFFEAFACKNLSLDLGLIPFNQYPSMMFEHLTDKPSCECLPHGQSCLGHNEVNAASGMFMEPILNRLTKGELLKGDGITTIAMILTEHNRVVGDLRIVTEKVTAQ